MNFVQQKTAQSQKPSHLQHQLSTFFSSIPSFLAIMTGKYRFWEPTLASMLRPFLKQAKPGAFSAKKGSWQMHLLTSCSQEVKELIPNARFPRSLYNPQCYSSFHASIPSLPLTRGKCLTPKYTPVSIFFPFVSQLHP